MAERRDPSRWQASASGAPWSGEGAVGQPRHRLTLQEVLDRGIEVAPPAIVAIVASLAGRIESREQESGHLVVPDASDIELHEPGDVHWTPPDGVADGVDAAAAISGAIALARRLVQGRPVSAGLARLLMGQPRSARQVCELLASEVSRQPIVDLVRQAAPLAGGDHVRHGSPGSGAAHAPADGVFDGGIGGNASVGGGGSHEIDSGQRAVWGAARSNAASPGATRLQPGPAAAAIPATLRERYSGALGLLRQRLSPARVGMLLGIGVVGMVLVVAIGARDSGPVQAATGTAITPTAGPPNSATGEQVGAAAAAGASTLRSSAPKPGASGEPWRNALAALDQTRSRAFEAGDATMLADADAPASPALARDAQWMRQLAASGLHTKGLRVIVRAIRISAETDNQVTLVVVDRRPAYRVVSSVTGVTVATVPQRREQSWQVIVKRGGAAESGRDVGWRIYSSQEVQPKARSR